MNTREYESVIADLRAQVAELEERVADLAQRAGKHSCLIDLCDLDEHADCRLAPAGEVWGGQPGGQGSNPWSDSKVIWS